MWLSAKSYNSSRPEKPSFDFQEGDVITATVRLVEKAGTIIDFNYKSDGFISNAELGVDEKNNQEKLVAGQTVQVYIEKLETKEGYTLMSRKKAQLEESWDTLTNASNKIIQTLRKRLTQRLGNLTESKRFANQEIKREAGFTCVNAYETLTQTLRNPSNFN